MATYIKIASTTVGAGGAASVSFSSISSAYTDLVLKGSARSTTGSNSVILNASFNGSTANFTDKYIEANGSTAGGYSDQPRMVGTANGSSTTSNTFTNFETYIPAYRSSNYKPFISSIVQEANSSTAYMQVQAGLWSNTAAITSIDLALSSGNLAQYSTFTLYGISNA